MASAALTDWQGVRADRLDELERVHTRLTGGGPGRRWLTEQLDRAYVLVLTSQFQGFCRDLHSETAAVIAAAAPSTLQQLVEASLTLSRSLDRGNPNAGNVGSDFARFGIDFWADVYARDSRNRRRRERLEQVMIWRNAIAHDSRIAPGDRSKVAGTKPTLRWGRTWRRALGELAVSGDRVVGDEVGALLGTPPW